jgi:3-oxoacyl-[acyl-carrier-protein] synthase III
MSVRITGVGAEVPATVVTTAEVEERAGLGEALGLPVGWLERATGVRQRRWAPPGVRPSDLAAAAALKALEQAGVDPRTVDTVVFAGMSRDFPGAATAQLVAETVGAERARVFDVVNASHGLIDGVDVADALIRSGKAERVLVATGERLSGAVAGRPGTMDDLRRALATLVLGDGGGALLLEQSDDPRRGLRYRDFRGIPRLVPVPAQDRPACAACGRATLHFPCGGDDAFAESMALLRPATETVMTRTGWRYADLDVVFCDQPTKRALDEAIGSLGDAAPAAHKVWGTAERYGNTATTSLPLAMAEAEAAGTLVPGAKLLVLAPSAGLGAAAVTLVW